MNKVLVSSLRCLDTNEDDVLDEQELEALFTKEVRNYRLKPCRRGLGPDVKNFKVRIQSKKVFSRGRNPLL